MYDPSTTNPYIKELSKATREENALVPQKRSNPDLKVTSQQNYTSRKYVDGNGFKVIEYNGIEYSMILKYKPDYVEYTYNCKIIYNGPCDATFFTAGLIDSNGFLDFDKSMKELDDQLAEWDQRFNAWEKNFELSNADVAELMRSLNTSSKYRAPHYTINIKEKKCSTGCCLCGCLIYLLILVAFLYGAGWLIGQAFDGIAYIIRIFLG